MIALVLVLLAAAPDQRNAEADRLFYSGDYLQALDLYQTLAEEKGNPAYLCNIGRCHDRLGQLDLAIENMRACVQRAKLDTKKRIEYLARIHDLEAERNRPPPEPPATLPEMPWLPPATAEGPTLTPSYLYPQPGGEGQFPVPPPPPRRARRSALPIVFGAIGLGGLVGGVAFGLHARRLSGQLEQRYDPDLHQQAQAANGLQVLGYLVAAGSFVVSYLSARRAARTD